MKTLHTLLFLSWCTHRSQLKANSRNWVPFIGYGIWMKRKYWLLKKIAHLPTVSGSTRLCHLQKFWQRCIEPPLIAEAIETYFIPVAIYNNKGGHDAAVLQKYNEPAWNNPVFRIVDQHGKEHPAAPQRTIFSCFGGKSH